MRARDNPFRVERLHGLRFRLAHGPGDGIESVWSRLRASDGRGAIVGPHGTGKTTLLAELAERLRGHGLSVRSVRIGAGTRALSPTQHERLLAHLTADDAVLLDGAGHLLPWHWWRVRRATRGARFLVVTCHRAGRLPTLLRTSSSPALLAELAAELGAPIAGESAARLLSENRGNVRDALRALYDAHAER